MSLAAVPRNRAFLEGLFQGRADRHGIWFEPPAVESAGLPGDVSCAEGSLEPWVELAARQYEAMLASLARHDDDSVPYARLATGTQLFASAFGCPVHLFEGSNAAAQPLVETAEEADALPVPSLDAPPLARVLEAAWMLRERLGSEAPIGVPDIQSPFDIAALVWRKESLYTALIDTPEAVHRLVAKCHALLAAFLRTWREALGEVSYAHCPTGAWAPPSLGIWLSEDEAGCMGVADFEEFCLPSLIALSEEFGGIFLHCCADADHQHASFGKIPGFRGINRVFTRGLESTVRDFTPGQIIIPAWCDDATVLRLLELAQPETRYLFSLPAREDLSAALHLRDRIRGDSDV